MPRTGNSRRPRRPLLRREFDSDTQAFTYPAFGASVDVTLDPGQTTSVVVVADRSSLVGPPGTENASLLVVTDHEGLSRIDVPVTATVRAMQRRCC